MRRSRVVLFASAAALAATVAALAFAFVPSGATAGAQPGGTEVVHGVQMKTRSGTGQSVTNSNMYYHGGAVSLTSQVYVDYWGSAWASGFSTGGYSSSQAQTYAQGFFGNAGGGSWHNIDSQYCQGVAVNTQNCGTSGQHITNNTGLLAGTCTHNATLPKRISQSNIATEAVWAMNNCFGGYNANGIYLVFTPTGQSMSGFGTQWCAWHSETTNSSNQPVAYGYIPYMPDAGSSCGMNYVNATNNSYGNGYFDGFSIVGGHEWMEAESDMNPSTSSTVAWQGPGGGSDENADKCAWNQNGGTSTNITLGSNFYAVQPIWSNASTTSSGSHCVTSY